jgi:hypothetical protein
MVNLVVLIMDLFIFFKLTPVCERSVLTYSCFLYRAATINFTWSVVTNEDTSLDNTNCCIFLRLLIYRVI